MARFLSVLWALGVAAAGLLLAAVADTGTGRLFAFAALLLAVFPLISVRFWSTRARKWLFASAIIAGACLAALGLLVAMAPREGTGQAGRVTSQFTGTLSLPLRFSPTNLAPEGDQLMFGFTLATLIDPLLTVSQAEKLRRVTASLYREQARDPDFARLVSVMPETYAEMCGFRVFSGHSYVYVPRKLDRAKPAPVLVFFHGAGGNFKAYLWVLSEAAERLGCALVAPTNGMGFWREGQGAAALESALTAAGRVASIDRNQVHVAGLSNGGRAISQLADSPDVRVKSWIFISPVFDPAHVGSTVFARENRNRSLLVITGGSDERVPLAYVEENVRGMKASGATVRLQAVPDADHFLIFTHRRPLVEALVAWVSEQRAKP